MVRPKPDQPDRLLRPCVKIPKYHQIALMKMVEGSLFIVRDKGFDCGFWICICCDFMVVQLSIAAESKDCIYSVACEV